MRSHLLTFLFLSSPLWGQTEVKVLQNASNYEDFIHKNPGCLENSECDAVMGHQLSRWNKLIKEASSNPKDKISVISTHLKESGIPIEFYTIQKVDKFFRPMLYNSHCSAHNPKEGEKILKGTSFVKELSQEKVLIWRDQTQIEFRPDSQFVAQPIIVHYPDGPITYLAGLDDQPLYIQNKNLYVLKDYEDEFFLLEISKEGKFKLVDVDFTKLTMFEDKKSHIDCSKGSPQVSNIFGVRFCKNIWDNSTNKTVPVQMHLGCAN